MTPQTRALAERNPANVSATRSIASAAAATAVRVDPMRVLRQHQWKIVVAAVLGLCVGAIAKVVFDQVYPLYGGVVLFELKPPLGGGGNQGDSIVSPETRTEETVERLGQTEALRIMSRQLLETAMRNRDIESTAW